MRVGEKRREVGEKRREGEEEAQERGGRRREGRREEEGGGKRVGEKRGRRMREGRRKVRWGNEGNWGKLEGGGGRRGGQRAAGLLPGRKLPLGWAGAGPFCYRLSSESRCMQPFSSPVPRQFWRRRLLLHLGDTHWHPNLPLFISPVVC